MALKIATNTYGKRDGHGFLPSDLIGNFSSYTGRKARTEEQIDKMVQSLLHVGQENNFLYRKGFKGEAIPVSGHTRILAAARINERGLVGKRFDTEGNPVGEVKYGPDNPFIIYGTYRQMTAEEALFHTFAENDDETRTPLNEVDIAHFILIASETLGLTDAKIAERLGKQPSWISNRRKLLELDPATQKQVATGDLAVNAAVAAAAVDPNKRQDVIKAAQAKSPKGKATAAAIAEAARELGADTNRKLTRTDAEFKAWLRKKLEEVEVGPVQAFLFGILDFRAGTIDETELDEKLAALTGEAELDAAA